MQSVNAQLADFIRSQLKNPIAFVSVQIPNKDGTATASQVIIDKITSAEVTRSTDRTSDTAKFTLSDDLFDYSSVSSLKPKYKAAFDPGNRNKKFAVYLGFQGPLFDSESGTYAVWDYAVNKRFSGYLETDSQDFANLANDKSVSLVDFTKQFQFSIYDTFPHPLYGDQSLPYFDPYYNLTNPAGDGMTWVCDGKMFTTSSASQNYGSTHIDPLVFVKLVGEAPASHSVDMTGWNGPPTPPNTIATCNNFSFDYAAGVVEFTPAYIASLVTAGRLPSGSTKLPSTAIVSVAGNPTYMAPEVIVRKIIVEKGGWDLTKVSFATTNVLIPQYVGQDMAAWDCIKEICDLTCPRFLPWIMYVDNGGVMRFEESRIDSPVVKTYIDERDFLKVNYSNSSQQISTVVRAEGTCFTAEGDQDITSLAFSLPALQKYGQTQPLLLDKHLTYNVSHLTTTQAMCYMNMLTAGTLVQVEHPIFELQADCWPDPSIEINDKIEVRSAKSGVVRQFMVTGISEKPDNTGAFVQQITADEFIDPANLLIGIPSDVTYDEELQPATMSPPSGSLIGSVKLGSGKGTYAFLHGEPNTDPLTLNQIVPKWALDGSAMRFDVFLDSKGGTPGQQDPYSYTNLPPQLTWSSYVDPATRDTIYWAQQPATGGYGDPFVANAYLYVGPDSVFYYSTTDAPPPGGPGVQPGDLDNYWTPPDNTQPKPGQGSGNQPWDGYMWCWWYLCLDGSEGSGPPHRPAMRTNPSGDGVKVHVPVGGVTVKMPWSDPPGPTNDDRSFYYGNLVVGVNDFAPVPAGFVGAAPWGGSGLGGQITTLNEPSGSNIGDTTFTVASVKKITAGSNIVIGNGNWQEELAVSTVDPTHKKFTTSTGALYAHNDGAPIYASDAGQIGVAYGPQANANCIYTNYRKTTRGHFCVYVVSSTGATQFLRLPFDLFL